MEDSDSIEKEDIDSIVMKNIGNIVYQYRNESYEEIATQLALASLKAGSQDNISVIKTNTAVSILELLEGGVTTLNQDQWDALNEGRLGKLFAQIKEASFFEELPKLTAREDAAEELKELSGGSSLLQ